MRKFIKKLAVGLLAATIIVGSSFTSLAATNCLHMRDYGCHNYAHRTRGTNTNRTVMGITEDGCYWRVEVKVEYVGECVCGAWGVYDISTYDEYERIR